jgi:hypothetical protein
MPQLFLRKTFLPRHRYRDFRSLPFDFGSLGGRRGRMSMPQLFLRKTFLPRHRYRDFSSLPFDFGSLGQRICTIGDLMRE